MPLGLGVTHTFKVGKYPSRLLFEGQASPIHQDRLGQRWNVRIAWAVFLPALFGKGDS